MTHLLSDSRVVSGERASRAGRRPRPVVLALDGHDGSGKTSMAVRFAREFGGAYVKPFDGEEGEQLADLGARQLFDELAALGRAILDRAVSREYGTELIVCDRHWFSLMTFWEDGRAPLWPERPLTIVCWASAEVTVERLSRRAEPQYDAAFHSYWCDKYRRLAALHHLAVLDTSRTTEAEAYAQLKTLAQPVVEALAR